MKKFGWCGIVATVAGVALPVLAFAWQPNQPETLNYRVYWGPLNVGKATLAYHAVSGSAPYSITVAMKDSTALVDFDSRWSITGTHASKPFIPQRYHALQKENDYRADKMVVFDAAKKTISYTNARDANDKIPPLAWDGTRRDVFSQLYHLRLGGLAPLKHGQEVKVMGTKRPITLVQMAPTALPKAKSADAQLWRIPLFYREEGGKIGKERWQITVREEADQSLTPVKLEAQTKFGVFSAVLK